MALHVRIVEPAYCYLESEALRRGLSMARLLSEILLKHKIEQRAVQNIPRRYPPRGAPPAPFDEKSGTTD